MSTNKHKHNKDQKEKDNEKKRKKKGVKIQFQPAGQSLEETGLAYVLPTIDKKNIKNFVDLPQDVSRLPTSKDVERKRDTLPAYCKVILLPMFASLSPITENLYLTSLGGMTKENFEKYKIGCIINATYEAPNLRAKGIESIRVPIDDSEKDNISEFFDVVADKIHEKTQEKVNIVVHCVAGISRSTTLVIAYLMKYHKMDLRTAYHHIHSRRKIIRPNNSFFRQLIAYEKKIFGKNSCKMINLNVDNVEFEVPDFFQDDFKGFVALEKLKQQKKQEKNVKKESDLKTETELKQTGRQLEESNSNQSNDGSKWAIKLEKDDQALTQDDKRKEDLIRRFVDDYKEPVEGIVENEVQRLDDKRKEDDSLERPSEQSPSSHSPISPSSPTHDKKHVRKNKRLNSCK